MSSQNRSFHFGLYLLNLSAAAAARIHVGRFWNEKQQTRVPFVQKFNEAIRGSEAERNVLGLLAWMWGAATTLQLFGAWGLVSVFLVGFGFVSELY